MAEQKVAKFEMNKWWEVVIVAFLAGILVSGVAVGAYFYFGGDTQENNGTYLLNKKESAKTNVDETLSSVEKDLNDTSTDLDTADVDAAINDLNSVDLSGV